MSLCNSSLQNWDVHNQQLIGCRDCARLVVWREKMALVKRKAYANQHYWGKPVTGFGDYQARVLVVGLAPGAHGSNRTGRMFTGDASGEFLYAALHREGFANQSQSIKRDDGLILQDVFITAVCRCAPPDNKPNRLELDTCRKYLLAEIELLKPIQGIVALGKIAFDEVVSIFLPENLKKAQFIFSHGAFYSLGTEKPWILASYHPSRQNTQTGRLTSAMFDSIWQTVSEKLT